MILCVYVHACMHACTQCVFIRAATPASSGFHHLKTLETNGQEDQPSTQKGKAWNIEEPLTTGRPASKSKIGQ